MSETSSSLDAQATAVTTLVGVVAYMAYELARNGSLNVRNFHKHLDDIGGPDRLDESPQEKTMRTSIIAAMRSAIDEGAHLAARD